MSTKISLRKTYSVYASKMHLSTMIFPFIKNEVKNGTIIKPILEKDISEDIEYVIKNVAINSNLKKKIKNVDWKQTNIEKIKEILGNMEELIKQNDNIDIVVMGTNNFIEKINELIDLWTKINLKELENSQTMVNVINCYNFEDNKKIDYINEQHEFILKTSGIEKIYNNDMLKKAN